MLIQEDSQDIENPPTPYIGGRKGTDKYRLTILTDGLLRFEWAPDGEFEDRPSYFAAHRNDLVKNVPKYRVKESKEKVEIFTSRFQVTYDRNEFTPGGFFVVVFGYSGTRWRYGEVHETLGGTTRTLDNVDGRAPLGPGVAARKGFAHLDDSKSFLFTDDGYFALRRPGLGRVDGYLFCYGHDYRESVQAFYKLSGNQPLLPRWTFGNWWSRYYEYSDKSYLELMDTFAKYKIPLSAAVIDMDWHLVRDPRVIEAGESGWTGYTWNKQLFPDPPAFIEQLHRRKLKVTLNDHPSEGVARYEDQYKDMARVLDFDTSHGDPIPFNSSDRAFVDAYHGTLLKSLEKQGVDFWWIDYQQGTQSLKGIDPLWLLNHYHFKKWDTPGARPIILSRWADFGGQRYPLGFSGDTVVSWQSLDFQPEFTTTASNVGFGYFSGDLGGHMLGVRDDHLTTRWVQWGVFSPIFRLHSTKNNWVCKEPWKLPAGSGQGPRDVIISFMRLRHRLIPYLHTMNARAADKDKPSPLLEPMYWQWPEREEAYNVPNQYYFGTEILVAPITTPQNRATHTGKVRAWLPPGTRWVDWLTGVTYDGNRNFWLSRTLDKIPLLLKQGAIVPLDGNPEPENGARNPSSFEVVAVVGANGRFEMMEEAEDGKDNASPEWLRTPIVFDQAKGTLTVGPTKRSCSWSVRFVGFKSTKDIHASVDDKSLSPKVDVVDNGLLVTLGDVPSGAQATVSVGSQPGLSVNDPYALMFPILYDAEVGYRLKEDIEAIMTPKSVPTSVRATQLEALDMDADLRLVLMELLLADSRS
ncbi:hypothetical protein HIM_05637 [Hirsutella minnesotensis 3608]|uniref:alpha-glucosidase n=1 Tax=Hirsutella minnesotensis 3608 TaxID=1043627 RepID=A0A0F7ZK22_9HYPO|nr:hypothetical protein HIM_05637 [Hirsutella minnesotensis 3608]